ncbi:hypothetical protein INT48_002777 [Thamnidium elegans]|uniref:SWIM-type domain-containing protein n=1 Tax=Thamnidium elegans TaxID=101142 RepID=A0A8H7SN22_9FUNG|nr:hypothetical protein INT48_002777 [Thamnidium elegans]
MSCRHGGRSRSVKTSQEKEEVIVPGMAVVDEAGNVSSSADAKVIVPRNKLSQRQGCEFKVSVNASKTEEGSHNHPIAKNVYSYPMNRHIKTMDQRRQVIQLIQSFANNTTISCKMNAEGVGITSKDVANFKKEMDFLLKGDQEMKNLILDLQNNGYVVTYAVGATGSVAINNHCKTLKPVFFAHESSIAMARRFNEVVVIDATYKTNRSKLPFVNVVGASNLGSPKGLRSFGIAGGWVLDESNDSYTWFVKNLKNIVWPSEDGAPKLFRTNLDKQFDKEVFDVPFYFSERHKQAVSQLVHKISHFALDKIKQELVTIDENTLVYSDCSCAIKVHYGLPCRHTIPRTGAIPLEMIPPRWYLFPENISTTRLQKNEESDKNKKNENHQKNTENYKNVLKNPENGTKSQKNENQEENITVIDITEEYYIENTDPYTHNTQNHQEEATTRLESKRKHVIQMYYAFEKRIFATEDEYQLDIIENALSSLDKEIVNLEDIMSPVTKMRKRKQGTSTKRDPIDDLYLPSSQASVISVNSTTNDVASIIDNSINLAAVDSVFSPKMDGNCGFRAVAQCLKRKKSDWKGIKDDMLAHLQEKEPFYTDILGQDEVQRVKATLEDCSEPQCDLSKWFSLPSCALIASNTYNLALSVFSDQQSILYAPFFEEPCSSKPLVLQLKNDHFYLISIKPRYKVQ